MQSRLCIPLPEMPESVQEKLSYWCRGYSLCRITFNQLKQYIAIGHTRAFQSTQVKLLLQGWQKFNHPGMLCEESHCCLTAGWLMTGSLYGTMDDDTADAYWHAILHTQPLTSLEMTWLSVITSMGSPLHWLTLLDHTLESSFLDVQSKWLKIVNSAALNINTIDLLCSLFATHGLPEMIMGLFNFSLVLNSRSITHACEECSLLSS